MSIRDLPLPLRALYCRPLLLFAACFGLGAVVALGSPLPLWVSLGGAGALLSGYVLLWKLGGRRFAALVMACALFLGAARTTLAQNARPRIASRYSIALSGTIADDPYLDLERQRLTCRLRDVFVDGEALGYDVRLYLRGSARRLEKIAIGQKIETTAHLWAPKPAGNPGEFDFRAFLWRSGIAAYATANLPDATLLDAADGFDIRLSNLRRSLAERADALFPHSADLVRALILGDRSDMSEDLRESFDRAGVSHVLSISGLHITLLAVAAMTLLRLFLPRRAAFYIALLLILLYGALVGLQPSVLRAILMYAALGMGQIFGRPNDTATRISLAFVLLIFWNPLYLQDAGFVLSFSASAGMFCLTPSLEYALRFDRIDARDRSLHPAPLARRALRYFASLICATLAAQLATLPAVVGYYGKLPLLATVANLAVVPLTLAGMLAAIPALLLSFIWNPLAAPVAFLGDQLMRLIATLTRLCAGLPLNELRMEPFPIWLTVAHGCILVCISGLTTLSKSARAWLLTALPATACLAILLAGWGHDGLEIVFLDAGQADAAVVRAQGEVYLVDVGLPQTPSDDYLRWAGLEPRAVFLSHPDSDHAGGLGELLDSFTPRTIYIPVGFCALDADKAVAESLERARSLGCEVVELKASDRLDLSEDVRATVLHPKADANISDPNGISMLLLIEYGEGAALFTGDLPIAYEPGPMPDVDLLKVAHHGSNGNSSPMALYSASPSAAVISVGAGNSYGHPAEALLERLSGTGARIYRTDQNGAVAAELLKDGGVRIRVQRLAEDGT